MSSASAVTPLTNALTGGVSLAPSKPGVPARLVVQNPHDGAMIYFTRDRVLACAENGDRLTYYPRTLDYSFRCGPDVVADFANGSIAVSSGNGIVLVDHHGHAFIHSITGQNQDVGDIDDPNFSGERAFVQSGVIDANAFTMLMQLRAANRDVGKLPHVREDFDPSTDAILEGVQQRNILQDYAPDAAPNPPGQIPPPAPAPVAITLPGQPPAT